MKTTITLGITIALATATGIEASLEGKTTAAQGGAVFTANQAGPSRRSVYEIANRIVKGGGSQILELEYSEDDENYITRSIMGLQLKPGTLTIGDLVYINKNCSYIPFNQMFKRASKAGAVTDEWISPEVPLTGQAILNLQSFFDLRRNELLGLIAGRQGTHSTADLLEDQKVLELIVRSHMQPDQQLPEHCYFYVTDNPETVDIEGLGLIPVYNIRNVLKRYDARGLPVNCVPAPVPGKVIIVMQRRKGGL